MCIVGTAVIGWFVQLKLMVKNFICGEFYIYIYIFFYYILLQLGSVVIVMT